MENEYNRRRLDKLEAVYDEISRKGSERARELEQRIAHLESVAEVRAEQLNGHSREVKSLENHLSRMENTLLKEFKISQDIMKSMLDHEWAIDKAKMDLKIEMERKEAEMLNEQRNFELQAKKDRTEFKRNLYIRIGAIGLPILTALATGISLMLENFFK